MDWSSCPQDATSTVSPGGSARCGPDAQQGRLTDARLTVDHDDLVAAVAPARARIQERQVVAAADKAFGRSAPRLPSCWLPSRGCQLAGQDRGVQLGGLR